MKNQVQLITYADRLGGATLAELRALLSGPLSGPLSRPLAGPLAGPLAEPLAEPLAGPLANVFGGVHILPFYFPVDGADAGFDPIDHTRVDPRLGDWGDIAALAGEIDVMADVIVNHVSSDSPQFRDFVAHGDASPHAGLFLTRETVFPNGLSDADAAAIYRPRPGSPFTPVQLATGETRTLWTTFTPRQIDIDVEHEEGRAYLESILRTLATNGVTVIRLDAVGYAIKRAGTSCFMLPETFAFIDGFTALARSLGLEVLVEVHSYYRRQIEIAKRVDRVYDFALPPLVLHAIFFQTAKHLKEWIAIRPANALTVLDTHDGIGIIDIGADASDRAGRPGLVPAAELDRLVEIIHEKSAGQSREATGAAASNLDLYQVNCSFYDALGRDDRAYLLARALQFFLPGVPQVYYVGLLAGENDMALLRATGVGRDINRHRFDADEVDAALEKPVVQELLALIRLRNSHPAFAGDFALEADAGGDRHGGSHGDRDADSDGGSHGDRDRDAGSDGERDSDGEPDSGRLLTLTWTEGVHRARLSVDFGTLTHRIDVSPG